MKNPLIAILILLSATAAAHEGVELGPNGGRILEFSTNETLHGEVTVKGDTFHIALLDKDMKPLPIDQQTLTATNADRKNPKKLEVTSTPTGFTLPLLPSGDWLIVRFKENAQAKAITARFEYDTTNCEGCNQMEWLCACKKNK
jgi:hypothetical protein